MTSSTDADDRGQVMSTVVKTYSLKMHISVKNVEDRVHRGRVYAPDRATVHYSSFFAPRGEMTGPLRKKDGTLGVAWVTERWAYEEAPEWLQAVVDAERPEWAVNPREGGPR